MSRYTFSVTGMHCTSCGLLIDETLEDLPGVTRSQTSVRAGRTVVDLDEALCAPAQVAAAITAVGYPAQPEVS
ncbi:cation transporter [Micromonospora aurantiaca]|jgi:Cu+-exporting ATPase|uniref:Heavy metal transporter n=1 Tax=Micromonospora aurantiaca (nom. illeg.) TaxID=47850 RepID=A0A3M9K022_9ACTN|nr:MULTISPECIES: cation transporter [Micromonospora]ADU09693.1 Heavy metal transport/detoxification protein [Micromonospora sp. L5]AXH93679.1 heavy metal transporter [Micromonospora aurantiaca]KAB1108445.1 heavy metal transporter [Micromonospora aurantiaca]MBC9006856.1 cation transporter [Micromonospora aurantiaca]MDG4752859.1 cation transporter [Micromonospora sp. WMMD718]